VGVLLYKVICYFGRPPGIVATFMGKWLVLFAVSSTRTPFLASFRARTAFIQVAFVMRSVADAHLT